MLQDPQASGEKYLVIKPGLNSPQSAPEGQAGELKAPFTVTRDAKYHLFARVNCPSADDDSFWLKIDDGTYSAANGLASTGWEWVKLSGITLKPGAHTLTFTYDAAGRRKTSADELDYVLTYQYDDAGRLAAITDSDGSTQVQYGYDLQGFLQRKELANGVFTTYQYDDNGNVVRMIDPQFHETTYTYDHND